MRATADTIAAVARIKHRYLRTSRHPSASLVPDAVTFDDVYETTDTFDGVYRTIVERLVDAAHEHGEVLYAVPGSPYVLERSVRWLRADTRIVTRVLPALSFLDLAYARLDIDPIEAEVTLIDAHAFATSAAGRTGPLLVAHTHDRRVLSDVKLAVVDEPEQPVTVLQRLGLPDEAVFEVSWRDLDRSFEPDHLTCIYIPRLEAPVGAELVRFHQIVRRLRDECPWDRAQTHASLARYAVEETYELVEAIGELVVDQPATDTHLIEELGDVLLQVVLHSAIGEQEGRFDLAEVAATISEKMVRRHPHVFGDVQVAGAHEVLANWETIKQAEKTAGADGRVAPANAGLADVPGHLPSLSHALETTKKAAKRGFDWDDPRGTLDKVREELAEIEAAWDDPHHVREEIGDLLFAVVSLARHRGTDPEVALRQATGKFRARFDAVLALAAERDIDTSTCGLATLDELWDTVKRDER
jgi:tetrapyrrole methylase family protein/MazG family protein